MAEKDKRYFARLDLDYADHPKIVGLSDAAFRAHIEMILYARKYLTDGVIPNRVANRFGFESVRELLTNDVETPSLIDNGDGSYLLHGYADMNETRSDVEARKARNSANGRRGGRPPKTQSVTESVSKSGTESQTHRGTQNKAEKEEEGEKEVSAKALTTRARELDQLFEVAYASWPKKQAKEPSKAKFKQACKKRDPQELVDDIRRFGEAYAATTDMKFIPMLSTWINQQRWTDTLPQAHNERSSTHDRAFAREQENLAAVQRAIAADQALKGLEAC